LEIERHANGTPCLEACVSRINPAGSVAKIALQGSGGEDIKVDLPFDRYQQLGLHVGDTVYVSPKRVRVFVPEPEYAI
jgi:sulfate transport system ATP-binding protein